MLRCTTASLVSATALLLRPASAFATFRKQSRGLYGKDGAAVAAAYHALSEAEHAALVEAAAEEHEQQLRRQRHAAHGGGLRRSAVTTGVPHAHYRPRGRSDFVAFARQNPVRRLKGPPDVRAEKLHNMYLDSLRD
jgi:hypothetical protein